MEVQASMRIPLERSGSVPLYAQIGSFLRAAIISGKLPVQTRMPSARRLAGDLGISRMTVEAAYAGLEAEGLVRREMGSGTFVMALAPSPTRSSAEVPESWPQWQQDLIASCASWHDLPVLDVSSVVGEGVIPFESGTGDTRRFPLADFRSIMRSVLQREGKEALDYGETRGYAPLRRTISEILSLHGLQAGADDVLITSGSQQGLALVAQLLLRPGDSVVVERPTYAAALALFRAMGVRIVDVPVDRDGMRVDLLETALQRYHPRLIYTIPNFQNPTGACMSTGRRRSMVALAERYDVAILEDDFVGDLRYEGRAQPPLKALDRTGGVIYVSTFSKMLMPGVRVGFVHADGPVLKLLAGLKRLTDLATSSAFQRTLHRYVSIGRYEAHLRRSRRVYATRRDSMARALERYFPSGSEFDLPCGGLFIWVRLPPRYAAPELLSRAQKAGVGFASGEEFFVERSSGDRFLRLNFAAVTPEEIERGIRSLGKVIAESN
jgi:GntR family transcriptional regulator / MocR family aminotransferase